MFPLYKQLYTPPYKQLTSAEKAWTINNIDLAPKYDQEIIFVLITCWFIDNPSEKSAPLIKRGAGGLLFNFEQFSHKLQDLIYRFFKNSFTKKCSMC